MVDGGSGVLAGGHLLGVAEPAPVGLQLELRVQEPEVVPRQASHSSWLPDSASWPWSTTKLRSPP